jgi:hypothetical protein
MQSNLFTAILLPLALAIVMLGMGLSLVPEDFKRITRYPKAVSVGTVCQVLLLPLVGGCWVGGGDGGCWIGGGGGGAAAAAGWCCWCLLG